MVWGRHNLASFSTENEMFYVNFAEKINNVWQTLKFTRIMKLIQITNFYNQEMCQVEGVVIL